MLKFKARTNVDEFIGSVPKIVDSGHNAIVNASRFPPRPGQRAGFQRLETRALRPDKDAKLK